ncbi:hypothetical protein MELA_02407 [Candidatus Methylomirabilis lanthanidiphila]|uniref:Uncharacterized protein n=1 Tax=Candidatus Methylomirabilis lanthanidiphila TaxID=2211376 RepID=A0A564ZLG7_9BACT|nr:hypothetical protein [Candidatus Methylomirabilis lanthanidiphila]VUZ86013.1 hypothetical protein MELA_02407 [Candidatus Methylomirabilis lanthanidiphila]
MFGSKMKLDEDLVRRCKLHAQAAGYSSVEEFIHHALESALKKASPTPPDEEEKVLDRLKGLGYIE